MRNILMIFFAFNVLLSYSQDDKVLNYWEKGGVANLSMSQISMSNWSSVSASSFAFSSYLDLYAKYNKNKLYWNSNVYLAYGLQNNSLIDITKIDDRLELNTKIGYPALKNINYLARVDVKTQLAPNYHYQYDSIKLSDFFAPAFFNISIGIDYMPNKELSLIFSPVSTKITYVNSAILKESSMFNIDNDKIAKIDFGTFIYLEYRKEVYSNIYYHTNFELFFNYLDDIDYSDMTNSEAITAKIKRIDYIWNNRLLFKINNFLAASIQFSIMYDNDILTPIYIDDNQVPDNYKSKTQFRELFGLGLNYDF